MTEVEAGGAGNRVRKEKLEEYIELARSDRRIVAFSMSGDESMATFLTYLQGKTSPGSDSWPIYVREDLNDPTWIVGSRVKIGDANINAPSPTGSH